MLLLLLLLLLVLLLVLLLLLLLLLRPVRTTVTTQPLRLLLRLRLQANYSEAVTLARRNMENAERAAKDAVAEAAQFGPKDDPASTDIPLTISPIDIFQYVVRNIAIVVFPWRSQW